MPLPLYDVVLLTDSRYVNPEKPDAYVQNILDEDKLLTTALNSLRLNVHRTNWDNKSFNWHSAKSIVFRTTWDYFHRFEEFNVWLNNVSKSTHLINPMELLQWNMDKHYLYDLKYKNIAIPPTQFIEKGEWDLLNALVARTNGEEFIIKPAVGGAGRLTYRFNQYSANAVFDILKKHVMEESFLLQEFQPSILSKGEVAYMVIDGKFTHAVLKKAKPGDFRVQDDFGGTVHEYTASESEIEFALNVVKACAIRPVYARVDVIWDAQSNPCVSELELVEPELWMRFYPESADLFAMAILNQLNAIQ